MDARVCLQKKYVASISLQWKLWVKQMDFQSGPSAVLFSVFERIVLEIGRRIEVGVDGGRWVWGEVWDGEEESG